MWNLYDITLLTHLWPLARCHCHHCRHHGCRCCFLLSCLSPHTLRINCHCLIFIWVSRGCRICHPFQRFRDSFGAAFSFKDAFDFDSVGSGAFEYNNIACEFSVERMLQQRRRNRRGRQPNRVFFKENVKKSYWYRYFTRPGLIHKTTLELSSRNRYREF